MKFLKTTTPLALLLAAAIILPSGITPAIAAPEASGPVDGVTVTSVVESPTDGQVTTEVNDDTGISGNAEVEVTAGLPDSIDVVAEESDGTQISDSFTIEAFNAIDETNFTATLHSTATGESFEIDTAAAEQQVLPVILVILARIGLQAAMKHFSKVAIQNAARNYALSLNASKWAHIMSPKHNWVRVGGTNKAKIADLMGKAIANGRAVKARDHIEYTWVYNGKTIVVRTSTGGHISNGWVR